MRSSMYTKRTATYRDLPPKKKKRGLASLAKTYLVLYNILMTVGWLTIAMVLVRGYLATRSYHGGYYHSVETPLKVFQTAAVLEILHSAVGIVPSSVALTCVQVASRVFVTWAVTHSVGEVQGEASVLMFLTAWTATEVIRYSFYTFSLVGRVPGLLKWARYSLFVVLYPVGVAGELLTMYRALPYVQKTGLYSVALPAEYFGVSFNYHSFLLATMASYVPLFPRLYLHMLRQRKKVLGHAKDHKVD